MFTANEDALLRIQSAALALQRDALQDRLSLIAQAEAQLDVMIFDAQKRVARQDLTMPALYTLRSTRAKLEGDRASTALAVSAIYLPDISDSPIRELVISAYTGDKNVEESNARLQRASDWDVTFDIGARHQLLTGPNGPYGEVTFVYNIGSAAEHRHLDKAARSFSEWKSSQEGDVVRSAQALNSSYRTLSRQKLQACNRCSRKTI